MNYKIRIIDIGGSYMKMLKTLKSNRPRYSEIFTHTPAGVGVARLMVDPCSYYVYTSDAKEISEMERLARLS
jgi:conjugal transfer ATP-binding protein TraC